MKEFFEFLNTCESGRTLFYIAFCLLAILLVTGGICTTILQLAKMIIRAIERTKQSNKNLEAVEIRGMLTILNKIIPKVPEKQVKFIVTEASDLPRLKGHFRLNEVLFEVEFVSDIYKNQHPDFSKEEIQVLIYKVNQASQRHYNLKYHELTDIQTCLTFLQ